MTESKFKFCLVKELVSENEITKTYIIRDKKYPFHAFCVHKETGMEIEQASTHKTHAIRLVERKMKERLDENYTD
jgi:signal recognition particle subunit SEC65